jgi:hypothetical protein
MAENRGYLTINGIVGGSTNSAFSNSMEVLSFSYLTQGYGRDVKARGQIRQKNRQRVSRTLNCR